MRLRPFHLALILFQALWLNVVVPGHTRGMITLGDAGCADCVSGAAEVASKPVGHACCSQASGEHASHPQPAGQQPTQKQRAACAICAFAARVAPPPAVSFVPVHLGLLTTMPPTARQVAVSLKFIPTYYGNGPPAALA